MIAPPPVTGWSFCRHGTPTSWRDRRYGDVVVDRKLQRGAPCLRCERDARAAVAAVLAVAERPIGDDHADREWQHAEQLRGASATTPAALTQLGIESAQARGRLHQVLLGTRYRTWDPATWMAPGRFHSHRRLWRRR